MKTDVTSIIGFADLRGRALLGVYGALTALLAIMTLPDEHIPALSLVSIVLLWGALVLLGLPGAEPFPAGLSVGVVGLVLAIALLCAFDPIDGRDPRYAAWYLGACTFLLLVLVLRGRRSLAFAAFVALAIVAGIAGVVAHADAVATLVGIVRQAGTLVIAALFATLLRRAAGGIAATAASRSRGSVRDAVTAVAEHERAGQMARLERDARPALEYLAAGGTLGPDEMSSLALLDESLRDGLLAAGFSGDELAEEVRAARRRGIRVVLADDRGEELPAESRGFVEKTLITELRRITFGTVTARLSAVERPELATIIVEDGGDYRRVTVSSLGVDVIRL